MGLFVVPSKRLAGAYQACYNQCIKPFEWE